MHIRFGGALDLCKYGIFYNSDGTSNSMKEPIRVHYIQKNVIVNYSHKNQYIVIDCQTRRTGVYWGVLVMRPVGKYRETLPIPKAVGRTLKKERYW